MVKETFVFNPFLVRKVTSYDNLPGLNSVCDECANIADIIMKTAPDTLLHMI